MMCAKFQINSSINTQAAQIIFLITEHVWECHYRECMGTLHEFVGYYLTKPNQTW